MGNRVSALLDRCLVWSNRRSFSIFRMNVLKSHYYDQITPMDKFAIARNIQGDNFFFRFIHTKILKNVTICFRKKIQWKKSTAKNSLDSIARDIHREEWKFGSLPMVAIWKRYNGVVKKHGGFSPAALHHESLAVFQCLKITHPKSRLMFFEPYGIVKNQLCNR